MTRLTKTEEWLKHHRWGKITQFLPTANEYNHMNKGQRAKVRGLIKRIDNARTMVSKGKVASDILRFANQEKFQRGSQKIKRQVYVSRAIDTLTQLVNLYAVEDANSYQMQRDRYRQMLLGRILYDRRQRDENGIKIEKINLKDLKRDNQNAKETIIKDEYYFKESEGTIVLLSQRPNLFNQHYIDSYRSPLPEERRKWANKYIQELKKSFINTANFIKSQW